jgi:hypothetical protein
MALPSLYGTSQDYVRQSRTSSQSFSGPVYNAAGALLSPGVFAVQTTVPSAVASSTAAGTLFGTFTGSAQLNPATWQVGTTYRVLANGTLNNTSTPNLTIILALGSTTIATTGVTATTALTSGPFMWFYDGYITCTATGTGGAVLAAGVFTYFTTAINTIDIQQPPTSTSVSLAVPLTPNLTATWGTSSASNTIVSSQVFVSQVY